MLIEILLGILLTAIAYMAVPCVLLLMNRGKFEEKRAKKFALWNSIVLGLVFCILTIEFSESGTVWNAAPAVLYYWINRKILTDMNVRADQTASEQVISKPTPKAPTKSVATPSPVSSGKVGNYGIIETSLAVGFVENARTIIKQYIQNAILERNLTRKSDLMKVVFGYVNQEFANATGPKTDLIVCAYYQIAFDEIVAYCGNTNDLIFDYAVSKLSGTVSKEIHQYSQMLVRIQLIIDDAIIANKDCNKFCGFLKKLQIRVFDELNSYIDDTTDWNKLMLLENAQSEDN